MGFSRKRRNLAKSRRMKGGAFKDISPYVPHNKAKSNDKRFRHPDYPLRFEVPDNKVDWTIDFPEYKTQGIHR